MAERILGEEGSRRRRRFRFLVLPFLLCTAVALLLASSAQAVHDLQFQLDGDVSLTCFPAGAPGSGGNNPCQTQTNDWGGNADNSSTTDTGNGLFVVTHPTASTESVDPNLNLVPDPLGQTGCVTTNSCTFQAASFTRDFESGASCALNSTSTTFCTGDDTTYATGSKDTLGIGNGGWQCNHDANVNSKIDIMNSYIASYRNAAGDLILYFGMEKNKAQGTNDVGVWFLRGTASCSAPSGHHNFTGQHRDGDVLIVSEFSNGGGVSTIKAFRWAAAASGPLSGDGGCIDSHDNPNPATGGCDGLPFGGGGDCKGQPTGSTDLLCATTNAVGKPPYNANVTTPWLTDDATLGVGHTVVSPNFYEGGINITQVFKTAGGSAAPQCFSVGIPDTRSSATLTATLFDFVINQLGGCKTTLATQENAAASRPINANGTISSGTDNATLKVTGTDVWNGTLTWFLCGPNVTTCNSSGVQVTSTAVHSTDLANKNPDGSYTYTSGTATLTSAFGTGQYCWHAHFEPDQASKDAGVDPADDNGANECFVITPLTPSLSTSASCSATPCVIGSTLNDFATLSGTANNPDPANPGPNSTYPTINGGTKPADNSITWTLFGPASDGSAQCATPISGAPSPSSIQVSGDSTGSGYGPVSYTTNHAGDRVGLYEFAASYPGEGPNTLAASPQVTCDTTGANGEQVTVIGTATSSSKQGWLPNDRITLNSTTGTTLNGTLTVTLYQGTFTGTRDNCAVGTATQKYQEQFTISSATNTDTEFTHNTNVFVGVNPSTGAAGETDGDYFWLIHYVDNSLTSPADRCETTTISHNDG